MSLDVVNLKNNLFKDAKASEVKDKIIERIKKLPNYTQYKSDVELLLLICNLLEYLINKKDKLDKKQLCLEIMNNLFVFSPDELKSIENNIEFLHSNKKIKKQSYYKLFMTGIYEFFKKKLL